MRLRGFSATRKLVMGLALFFLLGLLVMVLSCFIVKPSGLGNVYRVLSSERNGLYISLLPPNRKLLRQILEREEPERMRGERCTKADIVINQGPTAPLPNGIPIYSVEIMNVCSTGCDISRIHLSCGWFTSARLISPRIFKRIRYNDCLVNAGKPLVNGDTISFQYSNTFLYPLSVSSVVCH